MKNSLGMLASVATLLSMNNNHLSTGSNNLKPEDIDVTPKELPIPKGCNRYYFNKEGECYKGQHDVYFDVMKKESAYKKISKMVK